MSEVNQIQKQAQPAKREIRPVQDESQFANLLDTNRFEHLFRVANMFSESTIIPEHYRKNVGNCFIAVQMAVRLGVDPFMFMQKTYVVHGKPGMEAQLAIALMNTSGLFVDALDYEIHCDDPEGDPFDPSYRVRAYATRKSTNKTVFGPWVDWKLVKGEGWDAKPGSKWKTMPGMMFIYRAATFFGRMHCAERLMGMSTADELEDIQVNLSPAAISITDGKATVKPNDKYAAARRIDATENAGSPKGGNAQGTQGAARTAEDPPASSPPDGATAPANASSSTPPEGSVPEAGPSSETTATGTTGEARVEQAGAVGAQAASTPPKGSGRPKPKKIENCKDCGAPLSPDSPCTNCAMQKPRDHQVSKGVEQAEATATREDLLAELRTMADTYPTMYAAEKEHLKIGLTPDASDEKLAALREAMLFAIDAFKK